MLSGKLLLTDYGDQLLAELNLFNWNIRSEYTSIQKNLITTTFFQDKINYIDRIITKINKYNSSNKSYIINLIEVDNIINELYILDFFKQANDSLSRMKHIYCPKKLTIDTNLKYGNFMFINDYDILSIHILDVDIENYSIIYLKLVKDNILFNVFSVHLPANNKNYENRIILINYLLTFITSNMFLSSNIIIMGDLNQNDVLDIALDQTNKNKLDNNFYDIRDSIIKPQLLKSNILPSQDITFESKNQFLSNNEFKLKEHKNYDTKNILDYILFSKSIKIKKTHSNILERYDLLECKKKSKGCDPEQQSDIDYLSDHFPLSYNVLLLLNPQTIYRSYSPFTDTYLLTETKTYNDYIYFNKVYLFYNSHKIIYSFDAINNNYAIVIFKENDNYDVVILSSMYIKQDFVFNIIRSILYFYNIKKFELYVGNLKKLIIARDVEMEKLI